MDVDEKHPVHKNADNPVTTPKPLCSRGANTKLENEMNRFNALNTEGYSQEGIDALNEEWAQLAEEMGLEEFTGEYDEELQNFSDEVARR